MSRLESHVQRKDLLLAWYDRLIDTSLLHSEEVRPEGLQQRKEKLSAERFLVAICGQMNGGKSTLMNALLFQDEVLPMAPTTMTAKITLMEGAADACVEATLYTSDEWPRVVAAASEDEQAREELAEAREAARDEGLREDDLLQRPARVITEDGLQCLVKYVGVPDDGGLYSPYVKEVKLCADLPWLHQVTVADTPGTSDPNPERDKLTKKWIQQADAVIYVTYAGQAGMDATDVAFLDENLLHVPPARRVIAVNKCDGIQGGEDAIWTHLRGTRERDLRMQSLLADEDQVVLVSGQAGLIEGMEAAGRPLNEECAAARPGLAATGWLDGEKHGVGRLRQRVEERILSTRGDSLLGSHTDYLCSLFERATRCRESKQAELDDQRALLSTDGEQRAEERARINRLIGGLNERVGEFRASLYVDLDAAMTEAQQGNARLVGSIIEDMKAALRNEKQIDNFSSQGQWILSRTVNNKRAALAANFTAVNKTVQTAMENVEQAVAELLQAEGVGQRRSRRHFLRVSPYELCRTAIGEMMDEVEVGALQGVVKGSSYWLQRVCNTKGGRSNALGALEPVLGKALEESIGNLEATVNLKLQEAMDEALQQIELDLRKMLESRQRWLSELAKDDRREAEERASIDAKLDALANELAAVEVLKAELDDALGAL